MRLLLYSGFNRAQSRVGILVNKEIVEQVVEARCKSDHIMSIKSVVGSNILNTVSVYAPQIGLAKDIRRPSLEELDDVIQSMPYTENLSSGIISMGI